MKKQIILIATLLQFSLVFSQNEYFNKHNFLLYAGYAHSSYFEKQYHPAYKPYNDSPYSETKHPGSYRYPYSVFNIMTNYRYFVNNGFNINAELHYSQWVEIQTRNADSISKYYVYPDSIKERHPYIFTHFYEHKKTKHFNIGLNFSLAYQYKRFLFSGGIFIPIYEMRSIHREYYTDNKSDDDIIHDFYPDILFDLRAEFLVIKKRIPTSLYIEASDKVYVGLVFNISAINLKQ